MPRTRPLWQETTLLISIGKTFLNLHVFRWIHQVEKREETAESITKREKVALARKMNALTMPHPDRRPDKKERRDLMKFKHGGNE